MAVRVTPQGARVRTITGVTGETLVRCDDPHELLAIDAVQAARIRVEGALAKVIVTHSRGLVLELACTTVTRTVELCRLTDCTVHVATRDAALVITVDVSTDVRLHLPADWGLVDGERAFVLTSRSAGVNVAGEDTVTVPDLGVQIMSYRWAVAELGPTGTARTGAVVLLSARAVNGTIVGTARDDSAARTDARRVKLLATALRDAAAQREAATAPPPPLPALPDRAALERVHADARGRREPERSVVAALAFDAAAVSFAPHAATEPVELVAAKIRTLSSLLRCSRSAVALVVEPPPAPGERAALAQTHLAVGALLRAGHVHALFASSPDSPMRRMGVSLDALYELGGVADPQPDPALAAARASETLAAAMALAARADCLLVLVLPGIDGHALAERVLWVLSTLLVREPSPSPPTVIVVGSSCAPLLDAAATLSVCCPADFAAHALCDELDLRVPDLVRGAPGL